MAVRTSAQELIQRVRLLTGDVTTPYDLQDQDVQDVMDAHRETIRYEVLKPAPDIQPGQGGATTANFVWATYFSEFNYWENDVVLQGLNVATGQAWVILTPVTSESIVGKWTFAVTLPSIATPPAQYPPVWATGKVYDLYRVAAGCLERRIALRSASTFDFSASGGINARVSQILDRWEKLRMSYLAQAWIGTLDVQRTDLAPDFGGQLVRNNRTDSQAGLFPGPGPNVSNTGGAY